ncbi:hypothetical protein FH163_04050 [Staphylococcus lugdunensis]|nr:hypothetical protein [Staphylococcus lugdunensis]ADC87233.1 hypothetical protein SLGD_01142 [Staphylococcus lugdunensis HKU09-01]EKS25292.1 hypothetical protein HMPREF9308_00143 [Staphylococcus lugdunensis ACS-027-V-Sch2]MCH8656372.1 hypothetical protein [Staphylococcus lugdunensis]MCH8667118.1 hypothetical protein [Staphylococcus lugdunensis]MCI2793326.1 hypothetical protein [Staphylococcus lugdunensis]
MIKKELVEIYTNGLEETFSVGYVLEENENFIIFKSIDEKRCTRQLPIKE